MNHARPKLLRACRLESLERRLVLSTISLVPRSLVEVEANDAKSIFAADMDGDGDADVLSASAADHKIAWYPNLDGRGTLGKQRVITTDARSARAVYAVDLDRDGDVDVLSASAADDKIAWYENLGQGTFGAQRIISIEANSASAVFSMDLDGDGDQDVLSASAGDDKIAWYENLDGKGDFSAQRVITNLAGSAQSVFAADVDGDKDMDVLSASLGDDKIAWYENVDGRGTFGPQQVITTDADRARSVYAADMDGDGDIDVLSASSSDDKIAWYENVDGLGNFFDEEEITINADGAYAVYAADIDADGDVDVLSASADNDTIAWYENLGSGFFTSAIVITSSAKSANSVFAADLNGDGRLDVLSASSEDDKVAWYPQTPVSGIFGAQRVVTNSAAGAVSIAVADLDGDGNADLLSAFDNTVGWYKNLDGAATFGSLLEISTEVPGAWWVDTADLDGDDDLDVVVSSLFDDSIGWFENLDGEGNFGERELIGGGAGNSRSVFIADVDNDDDLDVLSASGSDNIVLYENTNGFGFFLRRGKTLWSNGARLVDGADVDGDGNIDLLSTHADGILWHPNIDSSGTYTRFPGVVSGTTRNADSVFAADIDNDGDLDVVSASAQDNTVAWHENTNGQGTFGALHVISAQAAGVDSVFAADIDGDGDLDVVAASSGNNMLMWYENTDSLGTFGPRLLVTDTAQNARSLNLADADNDGDLDLFAASWLAELNGEFVWYENRLEGDVDNDGKVAFPDFLILSQSFGLNNVRRIDGDLNGDGRVDFADFLILSANFGESRLRA